ncbi:LacI family DNA-binding transcriptional regulator [Alteromonas lipolytica]|uniref:DNA-binding transcriptional regulator GalS n=1 Tax=Alteromonas lipolytica TaxID=1856405 RepID=A0A1E8F8Z9_9ALTE|nr:LacI family DNA-binding transcriptional regulator [Alteromonas lipolytica]OFI32392.1 DNA-binding transcriptional regulator GalS [Alteromonas lipolytica]GGF80193.1 transcriptional regulator [Alteromonas lipolytica]
MTTIKDIAEAANVSLATVSRVINDGPKVGPKTRAHVKAVMEEMGYRPNINARALVTKKNTSLGLVLAELMDPFFATYADAIETVARHANTQLLMSAGSVQAETELKAIETLLNHRVKAMVVHAKFLDDETLISLASQAPGFVLINRYIDAIKHRCVWLDNVAGGRMMAEQVLKLGHRHIAVISSDFTIEDRTEREQGIRESLAQWGIELTDSQIVHASPNQQGGESAMRQLIASGARFTAVLAYNDAMASGAINVLSDHKFAVPDDVSVMGFDDVILAQYCRPQLTTLHYPIAEMASQAAALALDYAQGKALPTNTTYKYLPTFVSRNSVAKIKL